MSVLVTCRNVAAIIGIVACSFCPRIVDGQALVTGFLNRSIRVDGVEFRYQVYVPSDFQPSKKWPVLVVLHGGGDYGIDGIRQTSIGLAHAIRQHSDRFPALVLFPQAHPDAISGWQSKPSESAVLAELERTIVEFNADRSRVCLTGFSAGGNGAWFLAMRHPELFAGLVVVSGFVTEHRGGTSGITYPALARLGEMDSFAAVSRSVTALPVWIVHGDADQTISVDESRHMFAALKERGSNVRYTELASAGHLDGIATAYDNAELISWMLAQVRRA